MPSRTLSFAPLLAALLAFAGCAALDIPQPGDSSSPVGTKAWWRSHKKKATFVPGQGYVVEGVDGRFDQSGRPLESRVAKVVDATDEGGGLLGDADFKGTVNGFKEQVGLGPDETQAKLDFAAGEDLFRREKYADAAERFKKAAAGWPDSALEQDAIFNLGESYFFAEKYPKACNAYEKLIRKYPNSAHLDKIVTRQFAIASYWEQYHNYNPNWVVTPNLVAKSRPLFDTIGRSMKTYENIRLNDPTGPLADDSIMATANSYFLRGRFMDADEQYDLLRKEYPRSEHQYNAHRLGLQCKLRKYHGPDYDGTSLKEAQQLVKQLRTQFGGKLDPDQRERLAKDDAMVNRELALCEYKRGEYFENKKEYGAARFYYGQVMKEHGKTPLADQARERLAALQGLPDRPTDILEPVLELLPESSERTAVAQVPYNQNLQDLQLPSDGTQIASAAEEQAEKDKIKQAGGANSEPTIKR